MDDIKGCSNCKIEKLVINFHKDNKQRDGLNNKCKVCRKQKYTEILVKKKNYYLDNRDQLLKKQKLYNKENRDRIKEYELKNHDRIIGRKKI